ncbi:uncharacterized protein METZ01_LOCUS310296 [marine metagenome]|uniref:Uncharacterized protein n=1 Tax=marine metagenome TaxID=408172 RepID=A0A382NCJ1_9ZZZZ
MLRFLTKVTPRDVNHRPEDASKPLKGCGLRAP